MIIPAENNSEINDPETNKLRKENVLCLGNHPIFKSISNYFFDKNYFKLFHYVILDKNKTIFNEGDSSNSLYFLKKGFFELFCKKDLREISSIQNYLFNIKNNKQIDNYYENIDDYNSKIKNKKEISISFLERGDMCGYYLISKRNNNIFSMRAISLDSLDNHTEYFSIQISNFLKILHNNPNMIQTLNKYLNQKRLILINKLNLMCMNIIEIKKAIAPNLSKTKIKLEQKKPSKSASKIKILNNTFVESKIFPLKKYHKKRNANKPLLKFMSNLVKFVTNTSIIKKSKSSKFQLSNKTNNTKVNLSQIKFKFRNLNKLLSPSRSKKTISRNLNNNSLQYFESSDFSVDSSELKNEKRLFN